jgi:hypothetical protein
MSTSPFPASVVLYVQDQIRRRTTLTAELEALPYPYGFDRRVRRKYESEKLRLEQNITKLTSKWHPLPLDL